MAAAIVAVVVPARRRSSPITIVVSVHARASRFRAGVAVVTIGSEPGRAKGRPAGSALVHHRAARTGTIPGSVESAFILIVPAATERAPWGLRRGWHHAPAARAVPAVARTRTAPVVASGIVPEAPVWREIDPIAGPAFIRPRHRRAPGTVVRPRCARTRPAGATLIGPGMSIEFAHPLPGLAAVLIGVGSFVASEFAAFDLPLFSEFAAAPVRRGAALSPIGQAGRRGRGGWDIRRRTLRQDDRRGSGQQGGGEQEIPEIPHEILLRAG
ncbi:MAG: hypothetical protein JNM07_12435 [Phycisphaerae bacterium]|nr:hypothetical protein [Phycisphaerae bacterium]